MKKTVYKEQAESLGSAVSAHINMHGTDICAKHHEAALPLIHWLDYLKTSEVTGCCDEMLSGFRSALVEASGCLCLGLVRPAMFAMRSEIDTALLWLYYKDHPVEWHHVLTTGQNFTGKGQVIEYLQEYRDKFKRRYSLLIANKTRKEAEPYGLLSAHIHSQSTMVMPLFPSLSTLVYSVEKCNEALLPQSEVTEYIGDVFMSCFADKWAFLPNEVMNLVRSRLSTESQAKVFL